MNTLEENSIDSCISDFPYDLSFMGRKWDNTGNFYNWNKLRAEKLYRIIKHGGYVAIFGHPKTNHRMKCAFEDSGFKIVDEIDWIYLTGMPKSQDVEKLFTKSNNNELAEKWSGWKTAGLKPAHEPITIFQKPLKGTYIQNIEQYECGGMNIDACRISFSSNDDPRIGKGYKHNAMAGLENGKHKDNSNGELQSLHNEKGRYPSNLIFDEYTSIILDEQTGIRTSGSNCIRRKEGTFLEHGGLGKAGDVQITYGDTGGGSRMFEIIKYSQKATPSERKLPTGERNPHVTLKPVELIKWLIKLLTPVNGTTIDITAGSCTHAVACETLNKNDRYDLKYIDIELMNSEEEPYCNVGKIRVEAV